jgi:hypothetical protein
MKALAQVLFAEGPVESYFAARTATGWKRVEMKPDGMFRYRLLLTANRIKCSLIPRAKTAHESLTPIGLVIGCGEAAMHFFFGAFSTAALG